MKKFLAILWFIIIAGSIFIAINLFKPKPVQPPIDNSTTTNIQNQKPSQTYEEYLIIGDKLTSEKNYIAAIDNYLFANKVDPKAITPWIRLGEVYLKDNSPTKAREAFTEAEKIDPTSLKAKLGILQSYLDARDFNQAKNYIITLDNTNDQVKYYNGILLILLKDFDKAKTLFTEITTRTPPAEKTLVTNSQKFLEKYKSFATFKEGSNIFLQTLLAKALTEVGQYQASVPLLFDVINQKNNYRDAWIVLGYAYLNTNKTSDAVDAFSQAETLSPNKPETLFFLGLAYFADNNIDRAAYYIEQAEKNGFEPKDQVELKLGDLYVIQQKYEEAGAKYDYVLTANTSNLDIYNRAVWLNIEKLNNANHALTIAQDAVKNHPNEAMGYNLLGWSYTVLNDFESAKQNLQKALDLDPNLDAAYLNIGNLYAKQDLSNVAKEYYKRAAILGQGSPVGSLAQNKLHDLLTTQDNEKYSNINISKP